VITAGQDPASVGESSWSHLTTEFDDDSGDLTFSLYFPSLPVGTVGGGTGYPTPREALDLIGCRGTGRKWALAETVAAFALALDISKVGYHGKMEQASWRGTSNLALYSTVWHPCC
jgi:hydroxymethylglutaryl-CoA reductase